MSEDMVVAGIWLIDKKTASAIHHEFDDGIYFALDDSGSIWFAATHEHMAKIFTYPPGVGGTISGFGIGIDDVLVSNKWEALRVYFIQGKLGTPDEGINTYNGAGNFDRPCHCDDKAVYHYGCPSARGEQCPGRTWEPY